MTEKCANLESKANQENTSGICDFDLNKIWNRFELEQQRHNSAKYKNENRKLVPFESHVWIKQMESIEY